MSPRRYVVRLTEAEIRSLLALCPRCARCGSRAELVLTGRPRCASCASRLRRGRLLTPVWSNAADVLEAAISPFEVSA
jgi:hypothetical protein